MAIPWATRSLSVFVAAFNEAENLGPTVDTIMRAASVSVEEYEIIIVNDGSTDSTAEVLRSLGPRIQVIHQDNAGIGAARNRGVARASLRSIRCTSILSEAGHCRSACGRRTSS